MLENAPLTQFSYYDTENPCSPTSCQLSPLGFDSENLSIENCNLIPAEKF